MTHLKMREESVVVTLKVSNTEEIELKATEPKKVYENDYEKLRNRPKLNGAVIEGNMKETDPTVPAWAKENKKPTYTCEDIGAISENDAMTLEEIDYIFKQLF